jgi:SpoVK/Ycf46/Vps4 family AAA+-type ATPase
MLFLHFIFSMDEIQNLREALRQSPDNIPLKIMLAEALIKIAQFPEAEQLLKDVLSVQHGHLKANVLLARIYFLQQKYSIALVILEDLAKTYNSDPEVLLLYAKALYKEGAKEQARLNYQKVLKINSSFVDEEMDTEFRLRQYGKAREEDDEDFDDEDENDEIKNLEKPNVNFSHVGGMQYVKEQIELKIINPLKFADLYKAYDKKIGGGILLYGPPGCGKTYIAKATAGEINANFINVSIHDVFDMWLGASEQKLHAFFEAARKNAPCVLFFDEIDALGANRNDMKNHAGKHVINQFLSELDGVSSNNDGVLILGATNVPWHLDPAFRRPNRFDRIIFVPPPDVDSRKSILEILLQKKPVSSIDYATLAKKTVDYSGADLKAMIDICVEDKLKESFSSGVPTPILTKDLLKALEKHKPTAVKEWFQAAKNYALYANDTGLYDDIAKYLNLK